MRVRLLFDAPAITTPCGNPQRCTPWPNWLLLRRAWMEPLYPRAAGWNASGFAEPMFGTEVSRSTQALTQG